MTLSDPFTYIASTTSRSSRTPFGIRDTDRLFHCYCIGKTGTGKSTLILTLAAQDALHNEGFALFDPHGDLIREVLRWVPFYRRDNLTYLDVPDSAATWCFNPLAGIDEKNHPLAVAGLIEVFKKLWPDEWGPRLEHVLRNVLFVLLANEGSTLADVAPLLSDKEYRATLLDRVKNEMVRTYWEDEYAKYSGPFRAVVIAPLQNKLGALLTNPLLNRILTGTGVQLDIAGIMDRAGILLVNLDKGQIGEGPASVLGSFLVSHIALAGLARSKVSEVKRRPFIVYLDEFHTFATLSLTTMLSELRKYKVGMVLANQFLGQLPHEIRDAVFGNVGTIIAFRVGAQDASFLEREFAPIFSAIDLTNLPRYNLYIRLCIDRETSQAFSAATFCSPAFTPGWPPDLVPF